MKKLVFIILLLVVVESPGNFENHKGEMTDLPPELIEKMQGAKVDKEFANKSIAEVLISLSKRLDDRESVEIILEFKPEHHDALTSSLKLNLAQEIMKNEKSPFYNHDYIYTEWGMFREITTILCGLEKFRSKSQIIILSNIVDY